MTTEDEYLRSVERMLRRIDAAHRASVLDDLRGHFADAEDAGRPVEETIRGLGTPEEIAERASEEFGGSDEVDAAAERAWRVLQGAATVSALIIGVAVGFIVPTHTIATSEGGDSVLQHLTILQNDGLWVAILLLIPAVFAAVPLVVARAARIAVAVICGMLLIAVSLIAVFTVGEFFLPVLLLSWASLIVWARLRGSGFGRGWRIAGGVLAAAPVLLSIGSLVGPFGFEFGQRRRYADYSEVGSGPSIGIEAPGWLLVGAIVALAVLIAIGYRWAGWALAAVGFVALITGLVAGSLLALLFVWLGGWWLTIGLAHAVTASRRA